MVGRKRVRDQKAERGLYDKDLRIRPKEYIDICTVRFDRLL